MIFWPVVAVFVSLLICRRIHYELTLGAQRRRFQKQHGCRPITKVRAWDPILGLDVLINVVRSYANNTILQKTAAMLDEYGNTMRLSFSGLPVIMTIEPENLKYSTRLTLDPLSSYI